MTARIPTPKERRDLAADTVTMTLRVSARPKRVWEYHAARAGKTLSHWMRTTLDWWSCIAR